MLICLGVLAGHAEKRVALVSGNDRYANLPGDQQLRKAVNDARVVGDTLSGLGFEVIRGENLGRQALLAKFDEFTQRIEPGDTAFFFFTGHGVAIHGGNYILPTDVPNAGSGQDMLLARAAFGESDIVSDLQARGVRVGPPLTRSGHYRNATGRRRASSCAAGLTTSPTVNNCGTIPCSNGAARECLSPEAQRILPRPPEALHAMFARGQSID
jgi:hypothetical protein